MIRRVLPTSAIALALALTAGPAMAQSTPEQRANQENTQAQDQVSQDGVQVLTDWDQTQLYRTGLRAETLMDADVLGPTGDEIGSVENVILDQNNQIVAIIAQVGGFLDIGDTHVVVPWNEVQLLSGDNVQIPITEENAENYGLYAENSVITKSMAQQAQAVDDDLATGPQTWKLSNLLDDYATLRGTGYGYVNDAIFTRDGKLTAVVVEPSGAEWGVGPYAYPFRADAPGAWDPRRDVYELPYERNEVADLEPFEYNEMGDWSILD